MDFFNCLLLLIVCMFAYLSASVNGRVIVSLVRQKRQFGDEGGGGKSACDRASCCANRGGCSPSSCSLTQEACGGGGAPKQGRGTLVSSGRKQRHKNSGRDRAAAAAAAAPPPAPSSQQTNAQPQWSNSGSSNTGSNNQQQQPSSSSFSSASSFSSPQPSSNPQQSQWSNGGGSMNNHQPSSSSSDREQMSGTADAALEQELYKDAKPFEQYVQKALEAAQSFSTQEKVDMPVQELPPVEETGPTTEEVQIINLPDEHRQGNIDKVKEINTYTVQRKNINVTKRLIKKYQKNLFIDTVYNSNLQRVNHPKTINTIITSIQEVAEPTLTINYRDVNRNGQVVQTQQAPAQVENSEQTVTLPEVVQPVNIQFNRLGARSSPVNWLVTTSLVDNAPRPSLYEKTDHVVTVYNRFW